MEEKTGILAEVLFNNPDNGYTVGYFENEETNEAFTAVGVLHAADTGRRFTLTGQWVTHPKYGEQFAFTGYREELPTTVEGIELFLASGFLRGVGGKTAHLLVSAFGTDTLRVIAEEPERMLTINGIGQTKMENIAASFAAQREFADIALWFQGHGIEMRYARKLYEIYGSASIDAAKENPYQLIRDVPGIGFRTADRMAEKLGFDREGEERLAAGTLYALDYLSEEGNTYYPLDGLCEKTATLLDVSRERVEEAIQTLTFRGLTRLETLEGRSVVYPEPLYRAECRVAAKLLELDRAAVKPVAYKRPKDGEQQQTAGGIALSAQQWKAVELACLSGVAVITGGPGTGKTTILQTIRRLFEESGLQVAVCAPTGRAAKRITETSGFAASTIHRLLEYNYSTADEAMHFGRSNENPLEYDCIICDEASMIDIRLMDGLLDAIKPGTRLVIVGDSDQLPSVAAGNVLRDLLSSDVIPSVRLTEIFRQAQESLIVVNAHRINRGEYPDVNEKEKDFFFLRKRTEVEMLETVKELTGHRLPTFFETHGENYDPLHDIQVLTPVHKGLLGTLHMNAELQAMLNPPAPDKTEKKFGKKLFREGDKVMQTRNNYELEWKRSDDFTGGQGVFNGDLGYIEAIDEEDNTVTVVFDDVKYVKYDATNLDELELAYAITVHKSQGSEFPVMIMPVSWFPPMLATRNLFYTAVTRAKKMVVLVGSEEKMHAMIDNNTITERYSGLAVRLRALVQFSL